MYFEEHNIRNTSNWNEDEVREYLEMAFDTAALSDDPSTQVGCILVNGGKVVSDGYNHIAPGINYKPNQLQTREWKYPRTIHAETAACIGGQGNGSTAYGTWACCENCANDLAEAGVLRVISHYNPIHISHENWLKSVESGIARLKECGIDFFLYDGKMNKELRFNYSSMLF
jgi:deoxycytidylate deaminase